MKTEEITKTYLEKEFYASKELKEIFSPYAQSELDRFLKVSKTSGSKFIAGYVVKVDPKSNFGQPFKLYKFYTTSDGLNIVKEVSAMTMISSAPLQRVKILDGKLIFTDEYYEKNEKARKILGKTGMAFA
jgi:hypothetical protein